MKRIIITAVSALVAAFSVSAASVAESADPAFVFLQPEKTAIWRTCPGSSFAVPVPHPPGTEKNATLTVTGYRYSATYRNITGDSFELELPEPSENRPDKENVFDLTLTFADGSVETARIGGIAGYDGTNEGSTRCIMSSADASWQTVKRSAVLPVPYGTESVAVNGTAVDTGLDGAAGWFLLAPLTGGVSYAVGAGELTAMLNAYSDGTVFLIR